MSSSKVLSYEVFVQTTGDGLLRNKKVEPPYPDDTPLRSLRSQRQVPQGIDVPGRVSRNEGVSWTVSWTEYPPSVFTSNLN